MADKSAIKTVLVATSNKGKVLEITRGLSLCGWKFVTLGECGIVSNPIENGSSYEANARIKALDARRLAPNMAVIADDSGIEVDALGDKPGIFSARYAGEGATDANNRQKMLSALDSVPDGGRRARFVCVIVFIDEDGSELVARGTCDGQVAKEAKGNQGFGYDPIFLPDEYEHKLSMAELNPADKERISHRGKALDNLRRQIFKQISERIV